MHLRCVVAVLLLNAGVVAQTPPPQPCPADRPVDEIIAEIHKHQSKKSGRGTLLPDSICLWSWCGRLKKTPPTFPDPAPRAEVPPNDNSNESSSKIGAVDKCDVATQLAIEAAHDVEVGDFSIEQKNYRGALSRYQEAAEDKPGDVAIVVRMGRALEKLNEVQKAIEQYKAAEKLAGPEKWLEEARGALARLKRK